ncbi:MAG: hypothetical protein KA384_07145 [Leptotrichiaceae bacterium]|nr:hypothetical protein [Leptotrichiaceae bacterium]
MTRKEFLNNFWEYYCILENEFIDLRRYVELSQENFSTYSQEINKQLLSIGVEFENVCRHLSGKFDKKYNVCDFTTWASEIDGGIAHVEIKLKSCKELIILKPFGSWIDGKYANSSWWKAYNLLKHNKIKNYKEGNLKNLTDALAALYFAEMYYVKKIDAEYGVPNDCSKVFKMDKWDSQCRVFAYDSYISNREKTT